MFQFLGTGIGGVTAGFLLGWSRASLFPVFSLLVLFAMIMMYGFRNFSRVPTPSFSVDLE